MLTIEALGRLPSFSESNKWRNPIGQVGERYWQMVNMIHNYLVDRSMGG